MKNGKKARLLLAAVATGLASSQGYAQVLYEPFDYGNVTDTNLSSTTAAGAKYSTQGTYWATRGATPTTDNLRASTTLVPVPSYMGGANPILPPSFGTSARARTTGNAEFATLGLGEHFNTPGSLYWSATIKPDTIPTTTSGVQFAGILSFALPSAAQPSTRQAALWTRTTAAGTYQLGLGQNSNTSADVVWSPSITGTANSHLVVTRLNINAGAANDTVEMWIDPTSNFGDATAAPSSNAFAYLTNVSGTDLTNGQNAALEPAHAGFFIRTAAGSGNMNIDDVRIDSTWAGVTPDGNKQFTWNGAATGASLAATNWITGPTPVSTSPNGVGHVANFGQLGVTGTTLNSGAVVTTSGQTIDTINIRNANPITIGGTGITINTNASAGQIVGYSGGTHTISAPITLEDNLAIKADVDSGFILTGAIANGASGNKAVQKFGQGLVTLGAANILGTGVSLDVRAGTLNTGGFNQQADTLRIGVGHDNIGDTLGGPDNSPGIVTGGGVFTANKFDLRSGTIDVVMAGGNVVKNSATTITLTQANTYTGSTIVNAGVLAFSNDSNLGATPGSVEANDIQINGGGTLRILENYNIPTNRGITMIGTSPGIISIAAGKSVTYGGVISGTGGLTMTGSSPATLLLTGNSTYAGATNVVGAGNTMRIGIDNALPATTVLGLNGTGAIFDMGDASNAGYNLTVAGLINNSSATNPTITNTGTSIKTLTVSSANSSEANNLSITGNLNLVKGGTGALTLRGTNSYVGTTTVNSGGALIVAVDPTTAIPGYSSNLTVNSGAGFGVRLGADSTMTTGNLDTIQADGTVFTGANRYVAIEVTAAAGGTQTYGTSVNNFNGARGFMKYGGGTLALTGTNAYSLDTVLNGGVLEIASQSNIGDGSATNNILVNGTSTLRTTGAVGNISKSITLNAGTFTLDTAGQSFNLTGPMSGAGSFAKTGAGDVTVSGNMTHAGSVAVSGGIVTLSGNNSFAGRTTVSAGATVRTTTNTALGTAAGDTFVRGGSGADANSTLILDGSAGNLTIAENFLIEGKSSGSGGNATAHINNESGNNTISGTVTLDAAGTWYNLTSTSGSLTVSGGVVNPLTGTRQLNLRGAGNGAINGNVTNPGAATDFRFAKFDGGTWTLGGANQFAGANAVNGGTLVVANSDALGTGSLSIADTATTVAQVGLPKAISVASISTTGSGKFDITNNSLVIKNSTLATVTAQIVQGYNNGDFFGSGITSSTAANDPNFLTAVGYAANIDAAYVTFEGVGGLDDGDVLVKYTYYGDADLTGSVDLDDFNLFLAGYQDPANVPQTWIYGDFDYTGSVDLDDFNLFLAAYQANGAPLSTLANGIEMSSLSAGDQQMMLGAIAAVPEPGTLGVLAVGACGLLARRRRR
jgi:fibronectin-binding autotransporter adhesin